MWRTGPCVPVWSGFLQRKNLICGPYVRLSKDPGWENSSRDLCQTASSPQTFLTFEGKAWERWTAPLAPWAACRSPALGWFGVFKSSQCSSRVDSHLGIKWRIFCLLFTIDSRGTMPPWNCPYKKHGLPDPQIVCFGFHSHLLYSTRTTLKI